MAKLGAKFHSGRFPGGGSSWARFACSYKKAKPGTAPELPLLPPFAPLLRLGAALQQDVQLQGCITLPYVPVRLPAEVRNICCYGQSKEHPWPATPCSILAAALLLSTVRE